MLRVNDVTVRHGNVAVVRNISFEVRPSEIVALVGGNGAGKTSVARAIVGLSHGYAGRVEIFRNHDSELLWRKPAWAIAQDGIVYVPENRPVFEQLSVEENLKLVFAAIKPARQHSRELLNKTYDEFSLFSNRKRQLAGTLSGGEKRILAIAKALLFLKALDLVTQRSVGQFRLLLLDEPTHGLHPSTIAMVAQLLQRVNSKGVAILIIEQMVQFALSLATRGYVMRHGEIVASGTSKELLAHPGLTDLYLGSN